MLSFEREIFLKISLLLALLFPIILYARPDNPYEKFSARANLSKNVIVTWEYADDVDKACAELNKKYNVNPYKVKVLACSMRTAHFLTYDVCHIVTSTFTTMGILGHEIRHCFQNTWPGHPKY